MKRFANLIGLLLVLTLSVLPLTAFADVIPEGEVVKLVENGTTVEENHGTIIDNRGTVIDNSGGIDANNGTVTKNNGSVSCNFGTVVTNFGDVTCDDSSGGGIVTDNYGTVTCYGGGVVTNNFGSVELNNGGIVTNNFGTVIGDTDGVVTQYDILGGEYNAVTFRGQNKEDVVEIDGTIYVKRGATFTVEPADESYAIVALLCDDDLAWKTGDEWVIKAVNAGDTEPCAKEIVISAYVEDKASLRDIAAGVTVDEVPYGEEIGTNYGTIVLNEGNIMLNRGTVKDNSGWLLYNEVTVDVNNGLVQFNKGTVTENSAEGEVAFNQGKVITNIGGIGTQTAIGTVGKCDGDIDTNYGTVTTVTENGSVGDNYGTIVNNYGNVANEVSSEGNSGSVTNNYAKVYNEGGTVTNNFGTVDNNGGTVVNQYDILKYTGDEVTFRGENKDDVVVIDGTIYAKRGADIIVEPVGASAAIMRLLYGENYIYPEDECIIPNFNANEKEYTPKEIKIIANMGRNILAGETVAEVIENEDIHTNYGTIVQNNGYVKRNRGTITENEYMVGDNEGKVVTNNNHISKQTATGIVEECNGTVDENYGKVLAVTEEGLVKYNYNIVENNYGDVANEVSPEGNSGTVTNNHAKVCNDGGTVTNNYGTVEDNGGTVTNNYGTVDNDGGTVINNFGEVTSENGTVTNQYDKLVFTDDLLISGEDGFVRIIGDTTYVQRGKNISVASADPLKEITALTCGNDSVAHNDGVWKISKINKDATGYTVQTVTITATLECKHDYSSEVTTEPTCADTGVRTYTCSRCGDVKTESIPALGHTEVTDAEIAATCTTDGRTEGIHCSVCQETIKESEVIPAKGHDWAEEYTVDLEPTCTEAGSQSKHCSRCSEKTDVTEIEAKGHDWAEEYTVDTEPTCTEAGIKSKHCSRCEEKRDITPIDKLGHNEVTDAAEEPTATTHGKTEGSHCDRCGEVFVKQELITPHVDKETVTAATLKANGKIAYTCTICGEKTKDDTVIPMVKTVTLVSSSYTYNGKVKTPAVTVKDASGKTLVKGTDYTITYSKGCKDVGSYTVTVKGKGNYSFTKTLTFKINPVKTAIAKLTSAKKAFTVKWKKKTTQVSGYQIQYSLKKSFASAKTVTVKGAKTVSKTIRKLKGGKTYYVRIRTYKTVGKTKFYSDWSAAKSIKTKK